MYFKRFIRNSKAFCPMKSTITHCGWFYSYSLAHCLNFLRVFFFSLRNVLSHLAFYTRAVQIEGAHSSWSWILKSLLIRMWLYYGISKWCPSPRLKSSTALIVHGPMSIKRNNTLLLSWRISALNWKNAVEIILLVVAISLPKVREMMFTPS